MATIQAFDPDTTHHLEVLARTDARHDLVADQQLAALRALLVWEAPAEPSEQVDEVAA